MGETAGHNPDEVLQLFPALREPFHIMPAHTRFNCASWALRDVDRHWWPGSAAWPNGEKTPSVEAFREMFRRMGFEDCADEKLEDGFEKIGLYGADGQIRHVARQLSSGVWTSKIGWLAFIIEHATPGCLSGSEYGEPVAYMKRSR